MEQGRREFVKLIVYVGAGAAAAACGSANNGNGMGAPDCNANGGTASSITNNHGHELMVPATDFASPTTDHTYSIMGQATHDHMITLTGAQLTQVLAGTPVTVPSTVTNTHMHDVTAVCASGVSGGGGGGGY